VRISGPELPGFLKTDSPGVWGKTADAKGRTPGTAPQAVARTALDVAPDSHAGSPQENSGGRISTAFSSLLSRLKLPLDGLSVSIVSFAKFFSLPLNPALLAKMRRQAVSLPFGPGSSMPGNASGESTDPVIREACALACISALDKGVELSAESLERYARLISGRPLSPDPAHSGEAGENRGNAETGADEFPAESERGRDSGKEGASQGGRRQKGDQSGNPETLRNLVRKAEAGEPLLGLLNRIPGKDGKHWLVLPFPIEEGGIRLYAVLRLLLAPGAGLPAGTGDVEQMSLEINGERRRWLFICRPGSTLCVARWPETEEGERAGLERELAGCLGLSPGQIEISGWDPLFAPDCRDDDLSSVREEV
jgi:hypothetical protein